MHCPDDVHPLDEIFPPFPGFTQWKVHQMPFFGPPSGAGWHFGEDILAGNGELNEMLERSGAFWKTESAFLQAALLMPFYTGPIVSAAVQGLYLGERVPDVKAENFAVRLDENGEVAGYALRTRKFAALAADPASAHAGATAVPDRDALIDWMFDSIIERHLRPLFALVREHARINKNVLWSGIACDCASVLMGLQRSEHLTINEVFAEKTALLENGPEELRDWITLYTLQSGDVTALHMRYENCCQKYLHPDLGKCGYCGLRTVEEQRKMQQKQLDRRVAELQRQDKAAPEA